MKKLVWGLMLAGICPVLSAQPLRIIVRNDLAEPLPYAYIYVNDKAAAVTDGDGVAAIPPEKLQPGDTIRASYVGTEADYRVFGSDLQQSGLCELTLKEVYGTLQADEVKVSIDVYKLLKRVTRRPLPIGYNHRLTAPFTCQNTWRETARKVEGTFTAVSLEQKILAVPNYRRRGVAVQTSADTSGISPAVCHDLLFALERMFVMPALLCNAGYYTKEFRRNHPDSRLGYLGRRDGLHTFRLTFIDRNAETYQILALVDEHTGQVRRMEWQWYAPDRRTEIYCGIDYTLVRDNRPLPKAVRRPEVLLFDTIVFRQVRDGKQVVELKMQDPSVKVLPKDKKKSEAKEKE